MISLDLITGFLGAGKTTFIKEYVRYLIAAGEKVCIIENDFGAINVDMVILQELIGDNCNLEMIVGGDGAEAHKRRLKTKLISVAMLGYNKVIIEPSGIYDVDEFFDLVYEEPLDRWYEIGNVIAIVNPYSLTELSKESKYLLMTEVINAGAVVMSRADEKEGEQAKKMVTEINEIMQLYGASGRLSENKVTKMGSGKISDDALGRIVKCGFNRNSYVKLPITSGNGYQTLFYFDFEMEQEELKKTLTKMLNDKNCDGVHRIKGVVKSRTEGMFEINSTRYEIMTRAVKAERAVLIVIGEQLNSAIIEKYLGKPTI